MCDMYASLFLRTFIYKGAIICKDTSIYSHHINLMMLAHFINMHAKVDKCTQNKEIIYKTSNINNDI